MEAVAGLLVAHHWPPRACWSNYHLRWASVEHVDGGCQRPRLHHSWSAVAGSGACSHGPGGKRCSLDVVIQAVMQQSASTNLQSLVGAAGHVRTTARARPHEEICCTQCQPRRMQSTILQRRLAKPEPAEMLRETCSESASDNKSFGSEFALVSDSIYNTYICLITAVLHRFNRASVCARSFSCCSIRPLNLR